MSGDIHHNIQNVNNERDLPDSTQKSSTSWWCRWWKTLLIIVFFITITIGLIFYYYQNTLVIPVDQVKSYNEILDTLKTGDMFFGRDLTAARTRIALTNAPWSHVGLIYKKDDILYAIEVHDWKFDCVPLMDVIKEYQNEWGLCGIRRLNTELSQEQIQWIQDFIPTMKKCNQGKDFSTWSHRWKYFLKPSCLTCFQSSWLNYRTVMKNIEDVWLCTDLCAYILKQIRVLKSSAAKFCTKPNFFSTSEINKETIDPYKYEEVIFLLPIEPEKAVQTKISNLYRTKP